jgi:hypothetical protein
MRLPWDALQIVSEISTFDPYGTVGVALIFGSGFSSDIKSLPGFFRRMGLR